MRCWQTCLINNTNDIDRKSISPYQREEEEKVFGQKKLIKLSFLRQKKTATLFVSIWDIRVKHEISSIYETIWDKIS